VRGVTKWFYSPLSPLNTGPCYFLPSLLSYSVGFSSRLNTLVFSCWFANKLNYPNYILLRAIRLAKMQLFISAIVLLICSINFVSAGSFSPATVRAISPDNTCGNNGTGGGADGYICPPTLPCCSVNGFCGSTSEYCLTTVGCQAAFGNCTAPSAGTISPDETCGLIGAGTAGYTCSSASPCCSGK
jgi:hypothetical protein